MFLLLLNFIIHCNLCNILLANPIIGENVKNSTRDDFPAVVSIKYINETEGNQEASHVCTGTLLTRQDVVTAAHCEDYFEGPTSEVLVGTVDLRKGKKYKILWWMTYSQWAQIRNKELEIPDNDIAILRLGKPVSSSIPIPLRGKIEDYNYYGRVVQAVGFGSTATHFYFRYLQHVDLSVLSNDRCSYIVEVTANEKFYIGESYLCGVAVPYAILTGGNSGGPLFYDHKLIAIHKGTCPHLENRYDPRKINLFVSIYYYREYIKDVIKNF